MHMRCCPKPKAGLGGIQFTALQLMLISILHEQTDYQNYAKQTLNYACTRTVQNSKQCGLPV